MKADRIDAILPSLRTLLEGCCLCGHRCGVDRLKNEAGACRAAGCEVARYSSYTLHFGEEPLLVGRGGSGTVFFTHCNLRCAFCQNYQISQLGMGEEIAREDLARIFLELQRMGAENINLVTPTHYVYPILLALRDSYAAGLTLPLVYNTNGYDSADLLALLDGIVDIYLPDMKYMDSANGAKYSGAADYAETAKTALVEMYRQAGDVETSDGIALKGVIIRHLILPNDLAGTYDFLLWLKDAGLAAATVGLMSQYSPQYRAREFEELNTTVSRTEYRRIVRYAIDLGFENILVQGLDSPEIYLPDFGRDEPFDR